MNSSPSRKSGQSNFKNDGDDMPDIDLPQILQDTRSRRRTNTQEYRRNRYTNHRAKLSQNNTQALDHVQGGPTTQLLNQNSSISLKLSELSEWANQGKGDKAEAILMVLEEQGNAPRMAYLATIRAWLSRDRVGEALNVMARMEASQFKVKAADYRPFLQALIRNRQPDQAIRLLNHMAKCRTGRPILKEYDFEDPKRRKYAWSSLSCSELPDERCLMMVCNEFVKQQLPDRLNVVRCIFEWAKEYQRVDNYLFNVVLSAFDDPRDSEKFLLLHADQNTHAICYMTVMLAYFKHPYVFSRGKKMESLLRRVETLRPGGAIQPDLVTYRQIMQSYIGDKDGLEASRFLKKAFEDVTSGRIKDSPYSSDLFLSWSKSVIDQIAKGNPGQEGERAVLSTIQRLEQFFVHKNETLSIEFYHFVMDNHIRAKGASCVPFVELLYSQIQERYRSSRKPGMAPTAKSLNIVLKAYSKSRDAGMMEKAEGVLLRMEEAYRREKDSGQCIVPDVVSYTTVIQGWASCRCADAILRADMIAKRLNEMHLSGNEAAKPDRGAGIVVLNAKIWNRQGRHQFGSGGGVVDDENIMALVNATPPDLVSLSKLIKDWKSSDAGEKAEDIIDRLLVRYKETRDEEVLPDAQLFTSVINAWGRSRRSNAATNAELILDKMMLLFDLTKSEKMKPNAQHFLAVIRAYSQPNQPQKAQNAKRVFDQMMALQEDGFFDEAPSRDAFTAVLKACSHSKGIPREKERELEICQTIFEMICCGKYCSHNEATYGAYLGAIRNCMGRGAARKSLLKLAFERCCNDGFVDGFIMGQLRRSLSPEEFKDIVGLGFGEGTVLNMDDCPTYWGRNIVARQS